MEKKHWSYRLLSLVLACVLVLGNVLPAQAADASGATVSYKQVDNDTVSGSLLTEAPEAKENKPLYADTDMVRVSIFMDRKPTMQAGFSTIRLAENASAMSYRDGLKRDQQKITASIEKALNEPLDVCWNLTLAANVVSANVAYGDIEAIESVKGVSKVILENRYDPQVYSVGGEADPDMKIASGMTGTNIAWQSGYTGAGMRIAVIDTGLDIKHQSVNEGAYLHALEENAKAKNMEPDAYIRSLDLLDADKVAAVYDKLNISARQEGQNTGFTGSDMYISEKIPFGFNYVDNDLDVTHENDSMSEHGSHVSGIAAANRFIPAADGFVSGESVGVIGNAPDAQLMVMKVFGKQGGAYDSDYLAAMEDAILLGADSVNLSLGSANPGYSLYVGEYGEILNTMTESDTVVSISMGNNGHWSAFAANMTQLPYADHANFYTGGAPGSFYNPMTVASVDNDGLTGYAFEVAGNRYPYAETGMYCNRLHSMDKSTDGSGTDYEYVFLDSVGRYEDFDGIDVTGKVVFVARGEIPFADKGNTIVEKGGIAGVCYNTEPGTINMDLNMYYYMEPYVSISMEQGNEIRANSTKVTAENGKTYYTGTFHMDHKTVTTEYHSDYYNMSIFSSWGVPGNLTLKPDITTPGGNIYSINGAHPDPMGGMAGGDHNAYELMSGTSMAAPQLTGISALVLQSIQERGISQEGMTDRALAQSLMMSTATPMKDGNGRFYPVIQQGSGLANTQAATTADSFITVLGNTDGKVKAELKDDPQREGVYTFSFTVNNLEEADKVFTLSSDLFTQGAAVGPANPADEATAVYLTLDTIPVLANVTWTADGQVIESARELEGYDYNEDGRTDVQDAQLLMDVITGVREAPEGDFNLDVYPDAQLNTYDVHALLNKTGSDQITVPGGKSVEVTFTAQLAEAQKAQFDELYTGGAFVEGYINVEAASDAEGNLGTSHSIPMLAYYGSWTDNSMFDVGSYVEYTTGTENRMTYFNNMGSNVFAVVYGDKPNQKYYFGGNPLQPDSVYMPERNAMNSSRGDMIYEVNYAPIRNAIDTRFSVEQNGSTVYEDLLDTMPGAFFYQGNHSWQNSVVVSQVKWNSEKMQEGDRFDLVFQMAPELYYDAEADVVDWASLGDGAEIRYPVLIDNTLPTLDAVNLDLLNNKLVVTATDNQYISAVALFNATGSEDIASAGAVGPDAKPGETHDFVIDLDGINGKKFILQVADYAMNYVTYELEVQIGEELPMPEMMVFALDYNSWTVDDYFADRDGGMIYHPEMFRNIATVPEKFVAGTVVNHLVYASNEKGQLFVAPEEELTDLHYVAQLPNVVADMAYNSVDGELYGIDENAAIIRIDQITGDVTELGVFGADFGFIPPAPGYPIADTLAIDGQGRFYTALFGTPNVFTYTLNNITAPDYFTRTQLSSLPAGGELTQGMEWNPNDGQLYWHGTYVFTYMGNPGSYGFLIEMNPETYENFRYNVPATRTGALIFTESKNSGGIEETDNVTDVQLTKTALTLHRGLSADLDAAVRPWFVSDASVTWASDNEAVAVVDENGFIKTLDVGTCNITATSVLDPSKVGTCVLTVDAVDVAFEGLLKDAEGVNRFFTWDMMTEQTWTPGTELDANVSSAAAGEGDILYVNSATPGGGEILKVSKTTGEILSGTENKAGVPMYDMTRSTYFSSEEAEKIAGVWQWIFFGPTKPEDVGTNYFDLTGYAVPMFGLTSLGHEAHAMYEGAPVYDTEHFVALDGAYGLIDIFYYVDPETGPNVMLDITNTDLKVLGVFFRLYEEENKRTSLLSDGHGGYYASVFTGTQNDLYSFTYDAEQDIYHTEHLGRMGDGIWPAAIYNVIPGESRIPSDPKTYNFEEMTVLTAETQPLEACIAAHDETAVHGSLNAVSESLLPGAKTHTVSVTVTADNASTNGLQTVRFDADALKLVSAYSDADVFSTKLEDGVLTLGYASKTAIPAGAAVATLTFAVNTDKDSEVAFTAEEEGQTKPETTETVTVPGCPSGKYEDLSADKWYHEAVDEVIRAGYMNGVDEAHFAPYANTTRAQLITVLYRMAGSPAVEGSNPFTDVKQDSYYADAVVWAAANGIVKGVSADTFQPGAPVSRQDMVTFLARYAKLQGVSVRGASLEDFADAAEVAPYAAEAMAWAVENGILNGADGKLLPAANASRVQIAAVLYRCASLLTK